MFQNFIPMFESAIPTFKKCIPILLHQHALHAKFITGVTGTLSFYYFFKISSHVAKEATCIRLLYSPPGP